MKQNMKTFWCFCAGLSGGAQTFLYICKVVLGYFTLYHTRVICQLIHAIMCKTNTNHNNFYFAMAMNTNENK